MYSGGNEKSCNAWEPQERASPFGVTTQLARKNNRLKIFSNKPPK